MEAMNQKITAVVDEIGLLRAELISIKTAHASLHQSTVDAGSNNAKAFTDQADRIAKVERTFDEMTKNPFFGTGGDKKRDLIEAKQVNVEVF